MLNLGLLRKNLPLDEATNFLTFEAATVFSDRAKNSVVLFVPGS